MPRPKAPTPKAPTPKAGSYHIRFPRAVTDWLDKKRQARGLDFVQDVVRDLIQQSYEADLTRTSG